MPAALLLFMLIPCIAVDRPNHELFYTVGIDLCLEDTDILPNVILNCLLANIPTPPPDFNLIVERMLVDDSYEIVLSQMSNDSVLELNETNLASLFQNDTVGITVTCIASNNFGSNVEATSFIRVCGELYLFIERSISIYRLMRLYIHRCHRVSGWCD